MVRPENLVDNVAYHNVARTAEVLSHKEGARRRHKNHRNARDNSGNAQRKNHLYERLCAVCAEVVGGFNQSRFNLRHNRVERKHHKRQILVNHSEDNRALIADKLSVDTEEAEQRVNRTVVLQKRHPGVNPEQKVHPHRYHNNHCEQILRALLLTAHKVSQRIREHKADERGYKRNPYTSEEHVGISQRLAERLKAERSRAVGERVEKYEQNRDKREHYHPENVRETQSFKLHFRPPRQLSSPWRSRISAERRSRPVRQHRSA